MQDLHENTSKLLRAWKEIMSSEGKTQHRDSELCAEAALQDKTLYSKQSYSAFKIFLPLVFWNFTKKDLGEILLFVHPVLHQEGSCNLKIAVTSDVRNFIFW